MIQLTGVMRQEQRTGTRSLIRACYGTALFVRFWKLEMVRICFSIYLHLSVCAKLKEKQMNRFPKNSFIHHREIHIGYQKGITLSQHWRATSSFVAFFTAKRKQIWLCLQAWVKELTLFFSLLRTKTHEILYRGIQWGIDIKAAAFKACRGNSFGSIPG